MQLIAPRNGYPFPRHWSLPLLLSITAVALMLLGEGASEALRYQREAILDGEMWRLLTGHLVHLGWSHALMNLAALLLIWGLLGKTLSLAAWMALLFGCALTVSLGLLLFNPHLQWYVGLSGILHGLFLAGAMAAVLTDGKDGALLLAALVAKLVWEQIFGPLPGSEGGAGGAVIVDAHLYGAMAGAIICVLMFAVPAWRGKVTGDRPRAGG